MSQAEEKQLQRVVSPLIVPILISVLTSGIGAVSVFVALQVRMDQAERQIYANQVRFEEFTKEARDSDKQIMENVARQLDEIKRTLYRIEGRTGDK